MNKKLYAVKNDKGYYWDFNNLDGLWKLSSLSLTATFSEAAAKNTVKHYGGNVVTLIEEPEKVVLTKEQAEIVERAHVHLLPACYISKQPDDEELLMNAYVNGYTVAKDKKYGVWVPHVKGKMYYKDGRGSDDLDIASADCLNDRNQQFTEVEIEQYGLQDCEKEEVTDDGE